MSNRDDATYPCNKCPKKSHCDRKTCAAWQKWFCPKWAETRRVLCERLHYKLAERDDDINDFAHRLRILRVRAGLSQRVLGEISGVKQDLISRLELGVSQPNADVAESLAKPLKVSSAYLLTGERRKIL